MVHLFNHLPPGLLVGVFLFLLFALFLIIITTRSSKGQKGFYEGSGESNPIHL